jgi:hypothetical protein
MTDDMPEILELDGIMVQRLMFQVKDINTAVHAETAKERFEACVRLMRTAYALGKESAEAK